MVEVEGEFRRIGMYPLADRQEAITHVRVGTYEVEELVAALDPEPAHRGARIGDVEDVFLFVVDVVLWRNNKDHDGNSQHHRPFGSHR